MLWNVLVVLIGLMIGLCFDFYAYRIKAIEIFAVLALFAALTLDWWVHHTGWAAFMVAFILWVLCFLGGLVAGYIGRYVPSGVFNPESSPS